jgi:lipoprotein-anchoring transpeptidase ErfK/SrfK
LAIIVLNLSLIKHDFQGTTYPISELYQKKYAQEINKQSGNFDSTAKIAYWEGKKLSPPSFDLASDFLKPPSSQVLSAASGERWIEVILNEQRLVAHDGDSIFMNTLISSGKYGRTRKGDFKIWTKLRSTKMSGGVGRNYYYLPNVPCVMYFDGAIGLHGTYWHNNFGHTMSHGCVNMKTPDACQLFDWASVGTRVYVH